MSNLRKISLVAAETLNFKYFEVVFHWKLSSFSAILNFSLDVESAFETWSGESPLSVNSPQKALTILRQLSRDGASLNLLVHRLNMSYNLSTEFKSIYKRLK